MIAVTGSKGLVGREAVKALTKKGYKVKECTRENCDILDYEKTKKAFKGAEIIVHCAASISEESPDLEKINVKGTENVLEAAAEAGVKQFIFLSSVGVYGKFEGKANEQTPIEPETEYEKSKAKAEKKVLEYQELFHTTILRPSIIIGNNDYWKKIIRLVRKKFPLIGNGKNTWQTICASDVGEAIAFCTNNINCYGETFNIAGKEKMTLEEIVQIIREESGIKGRIIKIPVFLGNILAMVNEFINVIPMLTRDYVKRLVRERNYSTSKIRKIGWEPKSKTANCLIEIAKKS